MRMRWPLIGRSEEMRAIQSAISASDVSGMVVYGAAGVGKSRIAREALSAAESHGCEGRLAVGTSLARAIPLGVLSAWAPSGVTDTVQLLRGVIDLLTTPPVRPTPFMWWCRPCPATDSAPARQRRDGGVTRTAGAWDDTTGL